MLSPYSANPDRYYGLEPSESDYEDRFEKRWGELMEMSGEEIVRLFPQIEGHLEKAIEEEDVFNRL